MRLNDQAKQKLGKIFTDKDLIKDASKFTPAVMDALGESLGKKDAKSKQSIAGMANRFRDASMQGVDVDRLIGDMLKKIPGNIAFSNAMFGSKQGARIASAYGDPEAYHHILDALEKHADGRASKVSEARMAGYDGAVSRLEGSKKNLETSVGRSLDNNGEGSGGFLTGLTSAAAHATQALAELPNSVLAVGASAAWLSGKVAETAGTALLVGASTGVATGVAAGKGGAILAGAGAAATAAAPIALTAAVTLPLITADKSKGIVHGGKNVGPAQLNPSDELPGLGGSTDAPSWVRKGSLPPGEAGMPKPAPARLPGLDGRKSMPKPPAPPEPGILRRWYDSAAELVFGKDQAKPADKADASIIPARKPVEDAAGARTPLRGSLPPGTAGMPKAPQPRLPGLDGRPRAEAARQGDAAMLGGQTAGNVAPAPIGGSAPLSQLTAQAGQAKAKLAEVSAQTVAPQVDASSIEAVTPKADAAKASIEGLNLTARPMIDVASLQAAEAAADRLLAKLAQIGSASAGASSAVRSIPSPAGAIRGRSTSSSFSDGVTPGAGAE